MAPRVFYNSLLKDHKINTFYEHFQKQGGHIQEVMSTIRLNSIIIVADENHAWNSDNKSGLPDGVIYNRDVDYCNGMILYKRAFAFDRYRGKK